MVMQLHYNRTNLHRIFAIMSIAHSTSIAITVTPCSESTLTDRYQTTVPAPVRKFLCLGKNDRIAYTLQPDGTVAISRQIQTESDPILKPFLDLLAQDIEHNPQRLQPVGSNFVDRVRSLVSDVDFDLNESIDEDE
jgi:antitoxin PrlF